MIDGGMDKALEADLRLFCYLPFEHAKPSQMLAECGLDAAGIEASVRQRMALLGLDPLMGLLAGSITLSGGHGNWQDIGQPATAPAATASTGPHSASIWLGLACST